MRGRVNREWGFEEEPHPHLDAKKPRVSARLFNPSTKHRRAIGAAVRCGQSIRCRWRRRCVAIRYRPSASSSSAGMPRAGTGTICATPKTVALPAPVTPGSSVSALLSFVPFASPSNAIVPWFVIVPVAVDRDRRRDRDGHAAARRNRAVPAHGVRADIGDGRATARRCGDQRQLRRQHVDELVAGVVSLRGTAVRQHDGVGRVAAPARGCPRRSSCR